MPGPPTVSFAFRESSRAPVGHGDDAITRIGRQMHGKPHGMFFAKGGETKYTIMPQGSKSSYTGKQKRQAAHIEESYESRGLGKGESKRRAWATVNKTTGGGKKSGSGRGKKTNQAPARKGGKIGGRAKKR
jgi:hypothetical protein